MQIAIRASGLDEFCHKHCAILYDADRAWREATTASHHPSIKWLPPTILALPHHFSILSLSLFSLKSDGWSKSVKWTPSRPK
ncbi:hypothetical protein CDAR_180451 [Caerostris darwini]|uniref:Uncharacterized protein n=1 Tax=Caerostris darwini TaxID=1538125 RepID=A0AAV4NRL1_9ARAC|nr:hypothetical protein CDAR_180451 [Caerostris darwini]